MFRKRYRNDTTILPFRIRNNFSRRLLTRFDYATIPRPQGTTASGNDDDEIILQDDFENNEDNELLGQRSSNDEEGGENNEDNDSMLSQQSNNDEEGGDVGMMIISSESDATSEGDDDDDDDDDEYDDDNENDDDDDDEYEYDDDNENDDDNEYDDDDEYEYYTTSSESGGDYANTLSKKKLFVDTALDGDKLPYNNLSSDFAPYFQDFTTATLFFWIYKHNISTNAYEDLIDIIMNPAFNKDHIIRNIRRFRTWRQYLPLLPISATSIPISSKKTQSTSKDSKISYQLSINDIIWNVLNNPSLYNNMYFGPGVNSETKSEYWHGTLWAESPLFGQEQLMISGGNDIYLFEMFMIDLMTYFDIF